MVKIESQKELERWLRNQSRQMCVTIATRAALRVLPIVTQPDGREKPQTPLVLMTVRCILTSWVAIKYPTLEIKNAAYAASNATDSANATASRVYDGATSTAIFAASRSCDIAASRSGISSSSLATTVVTTAAHANSVRANENAGSHALAREPDDVARAATYSDTELSLQELLAKPLWETSRSPKWQSSLFIPNPDVLDSGPNWVFWRLWYQGFLNGEPLDWELQRRVALIDNAVWEAGAEAVAVEIEKIESAYEVETQAKELQESAYVWQPHTRGMGDNNPPSPLTDDLSDVPHITVIWAGARVLKEQAQSPAPDIDQIKKAIGAIAGVLKSCGLWVAGKLDKGINAAFVAVGATAGPASVLWLTQNTDKIHELINSAQRWLQLIQ